MTDETINRLCAESLEPKPLRRDTFPALSPDQCWNIDKFHSWQPRNFLTDPAMRDLLQAKLLEEGWIIRIEPIDDGSFELLLSHARHRVRHTILSTTREHLMAEAWYRTHGLGEK